jgi:hypothetical protein
LSELNVKVAVVSSVGLAGNVSSVVSGRETTVHG